MYSNCCCSCSFEPEIIKIGQSSQKMDSNNIVNFYESTTIINACTKKFGNLLNAPRILKYYLIPIPGSIPSIYVMLLLEINIFENITNLISFHFQPGFWKVKDTVLIFVLRFVLIILGWFKTFCFQILSSNFKDSLFDNYNMYISTQRIID